MKVARAITEGMRADRARDLRRASWGAWGAEHMYRARAFTMWGWSCTGRGGIGRPGA